MSDDSDLSSEERHKPYSPKRAVSPLAKKKSFSPAPMQMPSSSVLPPQVIQDQSGLIDENRKLRRKLKQLSSRLDEELEKAAQNKLKQNNAKNGHPVSIESQSMELQNAYKMIERLQKTVRDYESKESYQVTLKRVLDLESIIKKKEGEVEEQKG